MLTRHGNWQSLLQKHLESRRNEPFAWGTNDCSIFVADAILAHTGVDIAAEFRGKYTDAASAKEVIHTITGGFTVEDAAVFVAKQHGMKELPSVLYAQRGDMVILDTELGPAVGIVHLSGQHAIFTAQDGLHKVAVSKTRRAWRV
jgi:hypothetical protein